jgi:hypothetical protein
MKHYLTFLFFLIYFQSFSQIISPNGNNLFYYNGLADVTFKFPERGTGGRAIVHDLNNTLVLNYGGDFTGGTRIGNEVYFKDGGNSYILSGNLGIGNATPAGTLDLRKLNSNLVFDLNTNGISRIISKGWNADIDMHTFQINGTENFNQLVLNSNGYVGIGTSNPAAPLTVYGKSIFFPARITNGDARTLVVDYAVSNAPFLDNDYPVVLKTGGGNQPLILDAARIGIGTSNPDSRLSVNGTIHSKEVKVDLNITAPDYVFANDYKLRSLQEIESYVKENNHLPEIPSAKEFEKNGINISEMNMNLLKKVEELTLYLIEQNKEINALKKENNNIEILASKLEKLQAEIDLLKKN